VTLGLLAGRSRRTLASATTVLEGVGLHSGADASVRVCPAPSGTGRVFLDLASGQEIPALAANGEESQRCTVLRAEGASIQTVEHLLSALAALGVDDAVMEVRGGEIPAADGSAAPFLSWLRGVELQDQEGAAHVSCLALARPLLVSGDGGVTLAALPASHFHATVLLDYPQPWIGTQALTFDPAVDDYESIASARTFGFVRELDWLRARGLALGASHENALALGEEGYVGEPRFPDELVRHKLLDLIGDLSLVGMPLAAHIIAIKPSHAQNVRLARLLVESAGGAS
jgi:UDP-3-O-[3-hydroxymyristoyl] N-acetylglucosamine deacetylase